MHVDAETEPDLFWGLRGGGGNFGIATALEYRLHPVGPLVLGGPIFWPLRRGAGRSCASCATSLPRRRTSWASPLPRSRPRRCRSCRGSSMANRRWLSCSSGPATLPRASEPSPRCARSARRSPSWCARRRTSPCRSHAGWRRAAWEALLLEVASRSHALAMRSSTTIVARVESITSPFSQIGGWAVGGAVSRVDPSCDRGRRARGRVRDQHRGWLAAVRPRQSAPHRLGARGMGAPCAPIASGVYANFLSDEGAAGIDAAYGGRLQRLTALKDRYDPENVFRLNANIPPSQWS